ncbi:hypothetical protein GJ26_12185 [Vibrio cholerae]|nr:hypothetical protein GJ26_12185 [Vibrio cholerae]MCD1193146.1 hypothetical protein [Vibrio cholerae]
MYYVKSHHMFQCYQNTSKHKNKKLVKIYRRHIKNHSIIDINQFINNFFTILKLLKNINVI